MVGKGSGLTYFANRQCHFDETGGGFRKGGGGLSNGGGVSNGWGFFFRTGRWFRTAASGGVGGGWAVVTE